MKELKYKLMAIFRIFLMISLPLILVNLVLYCIGAFIAFDLDPNHWTLVKTSLGRFFIVVIEVATLSAIPKFWEDLF